MKGQKKSRYARFGFAYRLFFCIVIVSGESCLCYVLQRTFQQGLQISAVQADDLSGQINR